MILLQARVCDVIPRPILHWRLQNLHTKFWLSTGVKWQNYEIKIAFTVKDVINCHMIWRMCQVQWELECLMFLKHSGSTTSNPRKNERVTFVGFEEVIRFPSYPTLYHYARLTLLWAPWIKFGWSIRYPPWCEDTWTEAFIFSLVICSND